MRNAITLRDRCSALFAVLSACAVGLAPGGCSNPPVEAQEQGANRTSVISDDTLLDAAAAPASDAGTPGACACRCCDDDDDDGDHDDGDHDDDDDKDGGAKADGGKKGDKDKDHDKDKDKKKDGKDCADGGHAGKKPPKVPVCAADAGAACCADAGKKKQKK